jgi:8-oxo-dGTP pyrophosphatase MutT (NUDIX family)
MPHPPIQDAATLVIVDDTKGVPRVLMGRRRATQVFLPNVFVFPGGRAEADDALAPAADELSADEAALVAHQPGGVPFSAAAVRGLALAAVRETFEETGIIVGAAALSAAGTPVPQSWAALLAHGYEPKLSGLQFFLRAITPSARPRRYDTRFFIVNARDIAFRGPVTDEELSEIGWYCLSELGELQVPRITRVAIGELERLTEQGLAPASTRRVPFYYEQNNVMCRAELSLASSYP